MYQVLLVDDEPAIREGLRTLVDWAALGFSICGAAANGREGLQACLRLRPDAALVDIRMPGVDGLEMIEELKGKGSACRFLILTGYSDFQYAKRAIDYRVDGYLLKPVDPEELKDRLIQLHRHLEEERSTRSRLEGSRRLYREQLLRNMMTVEENSWNTPSNAEWLAEMKWPWRSVRAILIGLDAENGAGAAARGKWIAELQEELRQRDWGEVCSMDEYLMVLLRDVPLPRAVPVLSAALDAVKAECGADAVLCAGSEIRKAGDLRQACSEALKLFQRRFLYRNEAESGSVIQAEDQGSIVFRLGGEMWTSSESDGENGVFAYDPHATAIKLAFAVETGNKPLIRQTLAETAIATVRRSDPEAEIKSRYAVLYVETVHRLMQLGDGAAKATSPFLPYQQEISGCRSLRSLLECLHGRLSELTDELSSVQPGGPLRGILDFIHRHYDEDLKLETLGEMFHYNSGYLGKLFKQQTGEYFKTYVDRVRIEKAKEFLKQNYKVHQVASKVGFTSVDYFHGKFRKYVGQSPSSYRENSGS